MSNPTQFYYDLINPILLAVEDILNEWDAKSKDQPCLQIPTLMEKVQGQLDLSSTEVNAKEPVIRDYFRNHPKWYVRRGAHGGIGRREDKAKKEAAQNSRDQVKAQVQAELAKKLLDTNSAAAE